MTTKSKPAAKIYALADVDTDMARALFDVNTDLPQEFDTVEDGIKCLKDFELTGVVVTVSARVTPESRFKVERWK